MSDQTDTYYAQASGSAIAVLFMAFLVLASAVWVYFDARSIGARKGLVSGLADNGPGMWAFATVVMWIITFPLYLANRSKIQEAATRAAQRSSPRYGPGSVSQYGGHYAPGRAWGTVTSPTPARPPAGWYIDPERPDLQRWWDGTAWTEHRMHPPQ